MWRCSSLYILIASTRILAYRGYSRLNNNKNSSALISAYSYPCLCLCFGFSQITLMLPFLLMILHFSQIGFTDDLTFTSNPPFPICIAIVPTAGHTFPDSSPNIIALVFLQSQHLFLFISPDNSALWQIIWGQFQSHFISRKDLDKVHT